MRRIPAFQDLRLRMLERHLRGPVELAVLPLPAPSSLLSTRLDIRSAEAFEALLAELAAEGAGLSLVAPLDGRGVGQCCRSVLRTQRGAGCARSTWRQRSGDSRFHRLRRSRTTAHGPLAGRGQDRGDL